MERVEKEIRCHNCDKFLTKIILVRDTPTEEWKTVTESDQGFDVKLGIETKCWRCKEMDTKVMIV